ncbi:Protein tweety 2, partial [Aptenodytes forsteri]
VAGTTLQMQVGLEQHLARLNELLAARGDYLQTLKFMQQLAGSIVLQLSGLPVWRGTSTDLTALAGNIAYVEYYRWLAYLLFFILVLTVCLLACLGLAKRSRCLLTTMLCCGLLTLILSWASMAVDTAAAVGTSDFCVAPDKFIMNQTESDISAEVVHYYLYCDQSLSNPFQQALTVFQRSLTTMQIQIQGLIQFALPLFPTAEKDLLGVQQLLNSSETSLHQLTAMLDCRGLHKVRGGPRQGSAASAATAAAWAARAACTPRRRPSPTPPSPSTCETPFLGGADPWVPPPRGWSVTPRRGHGTMVGVLLCAPHSDELFPSRNQAVLFGGNPRYENVPLIGRGSPPPTVQADLTSDLTSMRATYLSVTDEHIRHHSTEFPA